MKKHMNEIYFSLYNSKVFWKKEKIMAFFYLCSLALVFSSLLLYCGNSVKKASFLFYIRGGVFGVLCLSIGIGFFIVWLQSLEERKEDFLILHMIGIKKTVLILSVQIEMLLFQIAASIVALFFVLILMFTLGGYLLGTVCVCLLRLHVELQGISVLASYLYMQNRLKG